MKNIIFIVALNLLCFTVWAQNTEDQNIFALTKVSFTSEDEMANYLKKNKPSTYAYFNRLSNLNKSKAFRKHQDDGDKDLTEIILTLYRQR
jgi:hypothetical protein